MWPVRLYIIFPHYLIKVTIFEKKKKAIEHKMCVLIFTANFYETFLNATGTGRDIVINDHRSSCKVLVILVRF